MASRYILPNFNVPFSAWNGELYYQLPFVPPVGAPDAEGLCCLLFAHLYAPPSGFQAAFAVAPKDTPIEEVTIDAMGALTDWSIVEIPTGSGWYYGIYNWDRTALGFPNEHQTWQLIRVANVNPTPPPPPGGDILLEDNTNLLLEDSTNYLLE